MQQTEFDRFADEYHAAHAANIRITGEDPAYFARYKAVDAAELGRDRLPLPSVLDLGTGVGNALPFLREQFPVQRIVGLDVSVRSLEIASARFPGMAELHPFDGSRIPFDDSTFGMVFVACVLHHVTPQERPALLREARRVLAPGGWLICFEHNPWNPLTARAVRDCPFDVNAQLLNAPSLRQLCATAGFGDIRVRYRVFFPRALSTLRPLERLLTWLPLGAQYCVVGRA